MMPVTGGAARNTTRPAPPAQRHLAGDRQRDRLAEGLGRVGGSRDLNTVGPTEDDEDLGAGGRELGLRA